MDVYVLLASASPKFAVHVVGVFSTHERAVAEVNRLWGLASESGRDTPGFSRGEG